MKLEKKREEALEKKRSESKIIVDSGGIVKVSKDKRGGCGGKY